MFELRRFLRLASVHRAEHGRAILWFLGIGIAVHVCVWLLLTGGGSERHAYTLDMQVAVFVTGYVLTAPLFAGRHFAALSDRGAALTLLMRPASTFEKWLLAFLMAAVFYPLAYTLAFQVCNVPGALLGAAARDALVAAIESGQVVPDTYLGVEYLTLQQFGPYLPFRQGRSGLALEISLLLVVTTLQALVMAGMLYFRRLAWLKTVVALFVLLVLVLPLLAMLFGASVERLWLTRLAWAGSDGMRVWMIALWLGVPALFWASTYCFLRERELG